MRSIYKALELTDYTEISEEIRARHELIKGMVGQLWPAILQGEIKDLRKRYHEITGRWDYP